MPLSLRPFYYLKKYAKTDFLRNELSNGENLAPSSSFFPIFGMIVQHRETGTPCISYESPTGTREADAVLCFVFSRDIKLELLVSPVSLRVRRTQTELPATPHGSRIG